MKDYIAMIFLLIFLSSLIGIFKGFLNGALSVLDFVPFSGDDLVISMLLVMIIFNRTMPRFEQKEGE